LFGTHGLQGLKQGTGDMVVGACVVTIIDE